MKQFTGIPVSPGIAIGKVFLYLEDGIPEIPRYTITQDQVKNELKRIQGALDAALEELKLLRERADREMSKEQAAIFAAHCMMLEDPDLHDQITGRIKNKLFNAEWAGWEVAHELAQKMRNSQEPMFRERAVDIIDVSKRVLYQLLEIKKVSLAELDEDVILAAHDLLPSDVLTMNKARVKGIVIDMGGKTSHTAILARAFNIPAVLGLSTISHEVQNNDTLVLDGLSGKVYINPTKKTLDKYQKTDTLNREQQDKAMGLRKLPAETTDGYRVTLKANIGVPEEADLVKDFGAEGIGLYRSEFLFLTPGKEEGEEQQLKAYNHVLKVMGKLPVTIRTLDLGGDKVLPDFQAQDDKNPLLGWRAIRFCLALPELFKIQLRAILRASVKGKVKIMFPLISGVEELEQAMALLEEAKEECRKKGQPFAENIETGIMIEVPAAAIIADILAEKSAFFSIGTNDLIQYTLAVDRGNEKVNYLAQPCHPAVIRFLKASIDAAHAKGIKAAMCGEMAGDPFYTALLLGLGLDEFSMSAQAIPRVKSVVRGVSLEDCRALAEKILTGTSAKANNAVLTAWAREKYPSE